MCYLSRSTFPNEANWPANELECGAIVWAIKKNRTLFYGIPFEVYSDHSSLRNLESLSEKNNRVQRWFDFLSAYTYELKYRPGSENGNADLLSRLPQPATEKDLSPEFRLTDPKDVDVYSVGTKNQEEVEEMGSVLGGRVDSENHRCEFVVGESGQTKEKRIYVISESGGVQGGVEETKQSWDGNVSGAPSNSLAQGSGSGAGPVNQEQGAPVAPTLEEELNIGDLSTEEAVEFGKALGEKKVGDWVEIQRKDKTASVTVDLITSGVALKDIKQDDLPEGVIEDEVKRLVSQGTLMLLEDGRELLVRKDMKEPKNAQNRRPGQFERLLGEEPVRTYVPMLVRPWVMDCCHKEAVHLGQKVTLQVLARMYWWVGMSESVQWWCRRCYSCQFRKVPKHLKTWPLVSLPLPGRPGQVVAFCLLYTSPSPRD